MAKRKKLFTVGNTKTLKGERKGYRTFIVHLSPASLSGRNLCVNASDTCKFICLNLTGHGGIFKAGATTNTVQDARLARSKRFNENPELYMRDLHTELQACRMQAKRAGLIPVFRLNGTSDIHYEDLPVSLPNWPVWFENIFAAYPDVQFYDYTKNLGRLAGCARIKNYHLTFSRSESNWPACQIALAQGHNVAVVFRKTLPKTYMGFEVIDGTESDLRFKDPRKPVIVGLLAKGKRAKEDQTGFTVDA